MRVLVHHHCQIVRVAGAGFPLLFVFALPASAQDTTATPSPSPTATPEPEETVVSVVASRSNEARHPGNSKTVVPSTAIERNPSLPTLNNIIADTVPGAAALPNGAIRIRGSDNQFSYYLDGAPLPANVSAFITDQINPKNIERFNVSTGAYPPQYGGQLSAIFDVTAKGGRAGQPEGFLQGEYGDFSTRNGSLQYSNGAGRLGYFLSGFRSQTGFRLSPITSAPSHNAGRENVGFGKFDYRLSNSDRLTFHIGAQSANLEVPNAPDREVLGQDDHQLEKKAYFNAIWNRERGNQSWRLAFYNHNSKSNYQGSPEDLIPSEEDDDAPPFTLRGPISRANDEDDTLISVNQKQQIRYTGLRGEWNSKANSNHTLGAGFEFRRGSGHLDYSLIADPAEGFDPLIDNRDLKSTDIGAWLQDDWTRGKLKLNYGARFDSHKANGTYSQLSPRLNLEYQVGQNDTLYAFYNRLWMPVPVESIRQFEGETPIGELRLSKVRPESDDYYGLGWKHTTGKSTITVDAYYKAIKNIIDNQEVRDTLLEVPINEAQGIVRGIELAYDRPLSKTLVFHGSYGLSRGVASGPVTGGLFGLEGLPSGYFIDDHDITHIATVNLTYSERRTYALLNGEFASGLPYGEIVDAEGNPTKINFLRAPSHFVLNAGVGHRFKSGFELAFNVTNLLNKDYIIAADNVFRRSIYGQRRAFGLKATWNF